MYGVSYLSSRQRDTYKEKIILPLRWDGIKGNVSRCFYKKKKKLKEYMQHKISM